MIINDELKKILNGESTPTQGQYRAGMGTLFDFITGLLGFDTADKAGVRANLGVSSEADQQSGKSSFAVATGSGDAMVVELTPALTAFEDGMQLRVRCVAANTTAAPTINVDGLGPLTIVGADGNGIAAGAYLANWPAIFRYRKSIGATPARVELLNPVPVTAGIGSSVRQTVLSGVVDANGYANFLSAGSGMAVNLSAATTPLVLSFANGFDAAGESNLVARLTTDVTGVVSGLAASNVSYILADYVSPTSVTWGKTLAPPQSGRSYDRTTQAKLDLNNSALDDFGNVWTNTAVTFSNSAPAISGTYMGVFNGSSSMIRTTVITTLGQGGWTKRAKVIPAGLPASGAAMAISSGTQGIGWGAELMIYNVGGSVKFGFSLSSNGSSADIASQVLGTTTPVVGTPYDVELTFDAIAGVYRLNVNGTQEASVTSSARVCSFTSFAIGARGNGAVYFNGRIQGFEFRPYCVHAGGASFAVPTALADISAAGYASDYFDIGAMKMYKVSGASTAAGANPAMTAVRRIYPAEVVAGAASVSSVVNYAMNGRYKSGPVSFVAGVTYAFAHNIGLPVEQLIPVLYGKAAADAFYTSITVAYESSVPYATGCWAPNLATRNSISARAGSGGLWIGASGTSAGTLVVEVQRGW